MQSGASGNQGSVGYVYRVKARWVVGQAYAAACGKRGRRGGGRRVPSGSARRVAGEPQRVVGEGAHSAGSGR